MSATRDVHTERAGCPLYTAVAVIDGRWKPMIFQRVCARPLGFAELRRAMPRVTTKVLRRQLRQMIADDWPPTWFGDSRGHWEGDTLVSESVNMNGNAKLGTIGHPMSDQAKVTVGSTVSFQGVPNK